MQLTLIALLGLYIIQINAAAINKRTDQPSASIYASASKPSVAQKSPMSVIDYNANKNYVAFQRVNTGMTMIENKDISDDDEEEENKMTSEDYTRPHHSLDQDDEGSHMTTNKKYGITHHVGSRQPRYRDSTRGFNPDPLLVVPMQQQDLGSKSLPRQKQKKLIGVDDLGHVRHLEIDSNKDEKELDAARRISQKNVVTVDDHGEQHTMVLPMTMLPGGRK